MFILCLYYVYTMYCLYYVRIYYVLFIGSFCLYYVAAVSLYGCIRLLWIYCLCCVIEFRCFRHGMRPVFSRLGAKDCTPEIDTSEIIVDVQWHCPMDCQWNFPTEFHKSVPFPKDSHLSSGFLLELSNGCSAVFSNGISLL